MKLTIMNDWEWKGMTASGIEGSLTLVRADLYNLMFLPEGVSWTVAVLLDLGVHVLPQRFHSVSLVGHHDREADVISRHWNMVEFQGHSQTLSRS